MDGSALAEQVLPQVAALVGEMKASVTLLGVLTPSTYSQKQILQPGLPWWDEAIAKAKANLATGVDQLRAAGLSVGKEVVPSDNIAGAILDYCAQNDADLLAFATHGVGGVQRLVFGSVADELTRRSSISLPLVHPGDRNAGKAQQGGGTLTKKK
jgi:nucleotide-binding universal stress UspA family protein